MVHRCKIDGTNYNIIGGRCKVDGTSYNIKSGRTKIEGTNYSITFNRTMKLMGYYHPTYCYCMLNDAKINNTNYSNEHILEDGDTIKIYVSGESTSARKNSYVGFNGSLVQDGYGTYTFSADEYSNIEIEFFMDTANDYNYYYCEIYAT